MPELTQEEQRLLERATTIAKANLDDLLHPKASGSFHFESQKQLFQTIRQFYADIASTRLDLVPTNIIRQAADNAESTIRSISQIQMFDAKSGDPNQKSTAYIENLRSTYDTAYTHFAPHLALARVSSSAIGQEFESLKALTTILSNERKRAAEDYEAKTKAADAQLKARIAEFEKVMTAAREASKMEAVSAQASEFDTEATSARTASTWWLTATIITVAVSLFLVWLLFLDGLNPSAISAPQLSPAQPSASQPSGAQAKPTHVPPESPVETKVITAALVQQTVARILIVTLLYTAVVWCARNFFACQHNYTVNRHRRNAMMTFRAFVEGTKDPPTQDFILRQAAACAFAPQQSGYLKDESLPTPAPASQIIDIIKPDAK
jgi:hypothetical protein